MFMSKKLIIGYFADGKWAHQAFEFMIRDANIKIAFICVRYDTTDMVLKNLAEKHDIEYLRHENINSKEFIEAVRNYNCDLFVSMSFNQIFRRELMTVPQQRTINCHAGKLPFYRGRNILNWALINDEKEFGITVHYVDEGIDTGDIILQKTYPISDEDDYSTLLERAYSSCAELLYKAIQAIQASDIKPVRQEDIHPIGFCCGMRKDGDERIIWEKSSRELFNFVRAICKPGPMARTTLNGKEMKINKVRMIPNAPAYICTTGQIVAKRSNWFVVKTQDTTLEVIDYEYEGVIKVGDRFL